LSTTSAKSFGAIALLLMSSSLGCWEQNLPEWFPQMKRQPAIQAFEPFELKEGQRTGLTPPDGTVPVGAAALPDLRNLSMAEQDALENPIPPTLVSLKNGEDQFQRYCSPCHGSGGLGDGPVAGSSPFAPAASGPFAMVLPVAGPMSMSKVFSDGHIYTTISRGRGRMPSYHRIPPADRWDILNYIREINTERGS
jgi:mono/diheme cytochrome c family protein